MQIIVSNKNLQKALKKLGNIVPKKPVIDALNYLSVTGSGNSAVLKATDLEVTMFFDLQLSENISKEDTALINFHWLKGISDLHGDEPIYIEALKTVTKVTASSGEYRQEVGVKLKEFPILPQVPDESSVPMIQDFVFWINSASILCHPATEMVPWKKHVFMEICDASLALTVTDANSLFTHTFALETSENRNFMVSPKVIKSLVGFVDTTLHLGQDSFAFTSDEMTIISKFPDGKFPDYRNIVPNVDPTNCSVERSEMLQILEKAKFINPDTMRLIPGESSISIKSENPNGQSATLSIKLQKGYQGEQFEIGLNPTKLQLLLTQTEYENVGMAFQAPNKAMVLTNTLDMSYVGLIMPIIINS